MSDNPEALPELPRPHFEGWKRGGLLCEDGFTAFQMRAYARAALAQQAATPTGPELLSDAVAEEIDELLGVIFQSARYERPSTDARPALEAFYRRHADLAEQAETLFGRMHARITELEAQIEQAATPAPAGDEKQGEKA